MIKYDKQSDKNSAVISTHVISSNLLNFSFLMVKKEVLYKMYAAKLHLINRSLHGRKSRHGQGLV